jgi:hypothetical protein
MQGIQMNNTGHARGVLPVRLLLTVLVKIILHLLDCCNPVYSCWDWQEKTIGCISFAVINIKSYCRWHLVCGIWHRLLLFKNIVI